MKTTFQPWAGNCSCEGVEGLSHRVRRRVRSWAWSLGVPETPPVLAKESVASVVSYVTQSRAVNLQVEGLSPP